jgi:hypothetical protein
MLNETSTETAHFIKDINAKDILGEHSAELWQIYDKNFIRAT